MYSYNPEPYQIALTINILIISYSLIMLMGVKQRKDVFIITSLFIWHLLFSLVYFTFSLYNVSDSQAYYNNSLNIDSFNIYPGTPFISSFTSIFSNGFFQTNYLNTMLIFNTIGTSGLVLLFLSIKKYLKLLPWYWAFILFIPSMSFWTASLGKDAFSFFSICLLIYALNLKGSNLGLLALSFISMFMVRPHVASLMLLAFIVYYLIRAKIHIVLKLITLPLIILGLSLSLAFVQQYIGISDESEILDYIENRQSLGKNTGSYVDIQSLSFPMKAFTYLFRPLPFEASSLVTLINSIENTILLFISSYLVINIRKSYSFLIEGKNLFLLSYIIITCSVLAMTTTNLGIATRQKWMFMPAVLYLIVYTSFKLRTLNTNYTKNKSLTY